MNYNMKKRANNKQLDFLIDQLLQNIDLARGCPSDRKVNEMWSRITLQLNTMGCKHEVSEWQHIWAVRVGKLKTKVRAMRLPDSNITLSETEKKVLTIARGASSVSNSPFTRLNQSIQEIDLYLQGTTNKNNLKQSITKDCSMQTEDPSNIIPSTSTQCRVCLMSGEDQIPIFTQNSVLAEQLQLICGIDIKLNDGYTQHLCISCSHLLQVAILFRKTAERSHLKLISETQSPEIKKEIEDSEDITEHNTPEVEIIVQDIHLIETNDDDPLILQNVSNIAVKCEDIDICEDMDITNRDQNKKNHLNLNEIEEDCSESDVSIDMEEQGKTVATNNPQSNEMDSDDDICTPPDILELATKVTHNLLPEKSRKLYEKEYNYFLAWKIEKKTTSFSENVILAYLKDLSDKFKPSSMWAKYSMLKSTLSIYNNIDITKYSKVIAFLKRNSEGHKEKKSLTFTSGQIKMFLEDSPDILYLFEKVALIFGIMGACRRQELYNIQFDEVSNIDDSTIMVNVSKTKTKVDRSFVVTGNYYAVCKQYMALRPTPCRNPAFFLSYRSGKCVDQRTGINKFGALGKTIASFLNLPNPALYTGHCFRRTSATLLIDSGGDLTALKRHGGWKSSTVAESYIDESDE